MDVSLCFLTVDIFGSRCAIKMVQAAAYGDVRLIVEVHGFARVHRMYVSLFTSFFLYVVMRLVDDAS